MTVLTQTNMLEFMAGLFDASIDTRFIEKDIIRCINMLRGGIHAILVVFSFIISFQKKKLM
ncbi:putative AIG1-type guanine nucleotide-binding (G) domain-containing protein [Helianthus anomalus]